MWSRAPSRLHSSSPHVSLVDVDHVIIGGGIVGLAIASRLSSHSSSFILLEHHRHLGSETTSRNSEVLHGGLYYPSGSLKETLCIRGKHLLYELFGDGVSSQNRLGVSIKRVGKWIIGNTPAQIEYLHALFAKCQALGVPTSFLPSSTVSAQEPLLRAKQVLESSTTGILCSHELLMYLVSTVRGDIVTNHSVTGMEKLADGTFRVDIANPLSSTGAVPISTAPTTTIRCRTIINAAGLGSDKIANMLLPPPEHLHLHHVKGHYMSYASPKPPFSRLVYPTPDPNLVSLGIHYTIDLAGRGKFGPDVHVLPPSNPPDYSLPSASSSASSTLTSLFTAAITPYFPTLDPSKLVLDYAGIRPKLHLTNFRDFIIREESSNGVPNLVNCVGIESPGLTAALAIAELVVESKLGFKRKSHGI